MVNGGWSTNEIKFLSHSKSKSFWFLKHSSTLFISNAPLWSPWHFREPKTWPPPHESGDGAASVVHSLVEKMGALGYAKGTSQAI